VAHYAYIDENNLVTSVIVGPDEGAKPESIESWEDYFSAKGKGRALQTSYNTSGGVHYTDGEPSEDQTKAFRGTYAGIGFYYDEDLDIFYPPRPYASWTLNAQTASWVAPIDYPADGGLYVWDETETDWIEVQDETP